LSIFISPVLFAGWLNIPPVGRPGERNPPGFIIIHKAEIGQHQVFIYAISVPNSRRKAGRRLRSNLWILNIIHLRGGPASWTGNAVVKAPGEFFPTPREKGDVP
jgi:hypothetical protein